MVNQSAIFNAKILLVDDQPANLELLDQLFTSVGYRSITSTTDPLSVAALHREHRYDLILLDLQMPGMDGFEVMEALKLVEPDRYLPVLVVTGMPSYKLRALQAGARDFLSKPFDPLEIQTRAQNLLEVRLLYKQIEQQNAHLEQTVRERTAELAASEARFRSLTELASDWFWEQDEHGNFVKVSGPVMEMLGLLQNGPAALPGVRWNDAERAALIAHIAARRPFLDHLFSRFNRDGSQQYFQVSGEPMFDVSARFIGYRGIGTDVTERMRRIAKSVG